MSELSGRHLFDYRQWRKEDGELNNVTLQTQMSTFKVFLRFCESIAAFGCEACEYTNCL